MILAVFGWAVESASYIFEGEGEFKPMISIFSIDFIPVEIGSTEFELTTASASIG